MQRNMLIAVGAAALVAGAGGLLLGRTTSRPSVTPPVAASREEPAAEPEALLITASRLQAAGIEVVQATAGALAPGVVGQGVVASSVGAEAALAARADGAVTRLLKRLGDPVRAGETVASIESRDASAIVAERSTAAAQLEVARTRHAREQFLFDAKVTARQDLEAARAELSAAQAEATRAAAAAAAARVSADGRSIAVISPVTGRISAAPIALGAFVTAGTEIYRVIDPNRIEIRATVPASEAGRIAVAAPAELELAPGVRGTAVVRAVTPDVDPVSRAATVILTPTSAAERLSPGQAIRVQVTAQGAGPARGVTVPLGALQLVNGRDVVFIRTPKGFRIQPVTVGQRTEDQVEVVGGLPPGTRIAGKNAFLLKAELGKSTEEEGGE